MTVEYAATNLNDEQKRWCAKWESEGDERQVRVDNFEEDGSANVDLHDHGEVTRTVLAKDGTLSESESEE